MNFRKISLHLEFKLKINKFHLQYFFFFSDIYIFFSISFLFFPSCYSRYYFIYFFFSLINHFKCLILSKSNTHNKLNSFRERTKLENVKSLTQNSLILISFRCSVYFNIIIWLFFFNFFTHFVTSCDSYDGRAQ